MRVLITWGTKRGSTESIARAIADTLRASGVEVVPVAARDAWRVRDFDAAIIGGALYANRWHPAARRFVRQRAAELRRVPTWLFSSGPLDDSASHDDIAPVRQVDAAMALVQAQGHVTFGGRLASDADTVVAKHHAGDWRDFERIRAWARTIAQALPTVRAQPYVEPPGHSLARLGAYGAMAWAHAVSLFVALLWGTTLRFAVDVTMVAAPVLYIALAWRYFGARAAREPLLAALGFSASAALLHLGVFAGLFEHSPARFAHLSTWLMIAMVFVVTLATGMVRAMTPVRPKPAKPASRRAPSQPLAAH